MWQFLRNDYLNRMMRFLVVTIVFGVLFPTSIFGQNFIRYSNQETEKTITYIGGNPYQKDFLLFMDILRNCHPDFSPGKIPSFDIDRVSETGYQWAGKECQSAKDLWSYMQQIAVLLNDGHTSLVPEIDYNLVYPVVLFSDPLGATYVRGINEEYKPFIGKQVALLNGLSPSGAYDHFRSIISSDNDVYFEDKVLDFIQVYSMWRYTSISPSDSTLHITFTDRTNVSVRPIHRNNIKLALQEPSSQHQSVRQNSRVPFLYTIVPEEKICYLQFNSCVDQNTMRSQYLARYPNISREELDKAVAGVPRFDTFLEEMFGVMRNDSIKTLVVDVRNNSGGNSRLCDLLLSWLKPVEETKYVHSYTRLSELWRQHYPSLAEEYEKAFTEVQRPLVMGELYDNYAMPSGNFSEQIEEVKMNINDDFVFDGNVIFIQNAGTYSSAGMLITVARDNDIGLLIGERSSYRPCNYGDMLAWELPNTNIRGYVSHKIFIRPNSNDCNESILMPDIELSPNWADVLNGKDICWEWILDNYGSNVLN